LGADSVDVANGPRDIRLAARAVEQFDIPEPVRKVLVPQLAGIVTKKRADGKEFAYQPRYRIAAARAIISAAQVNQNAEAQRRRLTLDLPEGGAGMVTIIGGVDLGAIVGDSPGLRNGKLIHVNGDGQK
jgi:hypothetical protein